MRNLTIRLVLLLMLTLVVITGVYDYLRLVRERERLVGQTQEDQRIFAETLALAVSRNVRWGRTTEELKELLDEILARPGLLGVAIFDPGGGVIAATLAPGAAPPAADEMVQGTLGTREPAAALAQEGRGAVLRYVQPFRWPGGRTGAIEVRQTLEGVEQTFRREVREGILSRLVVLAAFVLSVVALTRWNIARPIRALIRGARAVGGGDLSQRIAVRRRDEIGELAEEFNRMAANLEAARQQILRQVEERLRLEQEAQQGQKLAALGLLAAEVAHEIGTPLNIVSGRAEVLQQALPPDAPPRRHLDVIVQQTERIGAIVRALLEYARPKRPVLREEPVLPILARVAEILLGRCRARGVRIQLELPVGLPPVWGDADQLQQLFLNLLENALEASPPAGTIRVAQGSGSLLPAEGRGAIARGKAGGECLALHIVDAGPGIPPEQLERIFQPLFSTKERRGTGLGLPIVEEIVRAHRGEVEVLSAPGRGTEVIVRLPLAAAAGGRGLPGAIPEWSPAPAPAPAGETHGA